MRGLRFFLQQRERLIRWSVRLLVVSAALLVAHHNSTVSLADNHDNPAPGGSCTIMVGGDWSRTIHWVSGATWKPDWSGPWKDGTTVSVKETNEPDPGCLASDGVRWWGTWRRDRGAVGRGEQPSFPVPYSKRQIIARNDGARDIWWQGWPGIGGQEVAGTWYDSYRPVSDVYESVFQNDDSAVWMNPGAFSVEARCESPTGPPITVSFSARNANNTWSQAASGSSWAVTNAAGPGPWTVTASYGRTSDSVTSVSVTLSNGQSHIFVVTGCGVASGRLVVEARCPNGALVNVGAFDAWSYDFNWNPSSPTGWYASSGYGHTAVFDVPAGVSPPLYGRVWYVDASRTSRSVEGTPVNGTGQTISITINEASLCDPTPVVTPIAGGPSPTPTVPGCPVQASPELFYRPELSVWQPSARGQVLPQSGIGPELAPNEVFSFSHYSPTEGSRIVLPKGQFIRGGGAYYMSVWISPVGQDNNLVAQLEWQALQEGTTSKLYAFVSLEAWFTATTPRGHDPFFITTSTAVQQHSAKSQLTGLPDGRYKLRARVKNGDSPCAEWNEVSYFFHIGPDGPINVHAQWVSLSGQTIGALTNHPVTFTAVNRTDDAVTKRTTMTTDGGGNVGVYWTDVVASASNDDLTITMPIPAAPPGSNGVFLYDIQHSCTLASDGAADTATATLRHVARPPCDVTFRFVPLPIITATATLREADQTESPLASASITLTDQGGEVIQRASTNEAGVVAFRLTEEQARPRVGQHVWTLVAPSEVSSTTLVLRRLGNSAHLSGTNGIAISPIVSSSGNTFIYGGRPTPPAPPTATGDLYLNIHSTYDPQRGVYRSTTQEISWPQGEVLDFTPFVQLAPLPVVPPGWQYRQTVVAWSLVSTTVNGKERAAAAQDDRQRSGCRQRAEPPDNPAADLSGLLGCRYRYLDAPTSADMASQAHSYWAAFLPPQMRDDVYVYRLAPIQPVYLRVQVAVLVEVLQSDGTPALEPVTGRPLRQTQILEQIFKVNLVVPRSAR